MVTNEEINRLHSKIDELTCKLAITRFVAQKGIFGAAYAHKLNSILGLLRFEIDDLKDVFNNEGNRNEIKLAFNQIDELFDKLDNIESSSFSVNNQTTDIHLNQFLQENIERLIKHLPPTINFYLDLGQDINLNINPILLRNCLAILIENAIDSVQLVNRQFKTVTLKTLISNNKLLILISDTGNGISEDTRSLLFRQPVSSKKDKNGYGLLLAYVMAEMINGEVGVYSSSSYGATFFIEFNTKEH